MLLKNQDQAIAIAGVCSKRQLNLLFVFITWLTITACIHTNFFFLFHLIYIRKTVNIKVARKKNLAIQMQSQKKWFLFKIFFILQYTRQKK